jgi:protein ImuB
LQPPIDPLVIYEFRRGVRRVKACSVSAEGLGVRAGMPLAEAVSLAASAGDGGQGAGGGGRGTVRLPPSAFRPSPSALALASFDPAADRAALAQLAQWCRQFSPVVGLDDSAEPDSLLLDLTGLEPLLGSEEAVAERVTRALAGRGLEIRLAIADTIGAAWGVAHFGRGKAEGGRRTVPRPPFPTDLGPLPIEALRLPGETVELLHQLGVYRVEQLGALPRAELDSRFGPVLLERWNQATGRRAEPIPALPLDPQWAVRWELEYPTARRENLEVILERLTGQLVRRLAERGRGMARLDCRLECVGAAVVEFSVGFFRASGSAAYVLALVGARLERLSVAAPVSAVQVRAAATAPVHPRQEGLFFDGRPRHPVRELPELIDRLNGRLGCRAVVRPRLATEAQPELAYWYEPLVEGGRRKGEGGRRKVEGERRTTSPAPPPAPRSPFRPIRLVRQPARLAVVATALGGPPLRFCWGRRQYGVVQSWGPERIETGWWRGRGVARDYYRLETEGGGRFWVFRRLTDGEWFLHGRFE